MVIKIVVALLLFVSAPAWATPPNDIQLKYDMDKKILHVEAAHPSDKLDKHYIHTLTLTINDADEKKFYYTHQLSPAKFAADIEEVEANPGDLIKVNLDCIQGGSKAAELKLEKPSEDQKSPEHP